MDALRAARFAFAAGLLLLLAGCANTQQHARDLLTVTLYDYSSAIRWNRPDAAAKWLDPDVESIRVKPIDLERFAQVQITGYEVKGSEQIGPEKYAQLVEIRLINIHTQTERTIVDQQVWRYDPEIRQWWITTGLPNLSR
jgi:hypothetical protein